MIKKLSCVLITTILLVTGEIGKAQDPIFSQFYANPLYLNPAMAGSAVCPRLNLNYKKAKSAKNFIVLMRFWTTLKNNVL